MHDVMFCNEPVHAVRFIYWLLSLGFVYGCRMASLGALHATDSTGTYLSAFSLASLDLFFMINDQKLMWLFS